MNTLLVVFLGLVITYGTAAQSLENGIDLFKAEKIEAAEKEFKNYLKGHPQDPMALEYLGDISFKQEKWNQAASYFRPLVKTNKQNAVYHFKYAGAIGLEAKKNKLKALFLIDDIKYHFKQAALLDPKYIDARLALVQLYLQLPSALGGSKQIANKYAEELKFLNIKAYNKAKKFIEKAG